MHPHRTGKMARWAAAAALALALLAGGIFAHRQWLASRALRQVPPAAPAKVQQRSLQFTFSKMDGQQTVFTIHAARATRYSGGSGSVLDDVDIEVNGEHGERHDEIHTRSCGYEPETGSIVCHGKVELDLSSVPLGKPVNLLPHSGIRVAAQDVTFNRDTGKATTGGPVTFHFPQGEGSGEGADYSSRGADFHFRRDVKIRLTAGQAGVDPTLVTAKGGLTFDRRTNELRLSGPVEIRQGDRQIDAGDLIVDLNNRLRPQRALASGKALVRVAEGTRRGGLQAESVEVLFDSRGRARQIHASGRLVFIAKGPETTRLKAQNATIRLDPADQQPRTVDLNGDVQVEQKRPAGFVRLNGDALRLVMAPVAAGAKAVGLVEATTPGKANGEWNSESGDLRLTSGRLAIRFRTNNQIQDLRGFDGVRLERLQPGQTPLVTTARHLALRFSGGRWAEAEESGHVRATQGSRSGSADRAVWTRANDAIELSGEARVNDPNGQLLADKMDWNRKSGLVRATGHVRSTYAAGTGRGIGTAPGGSQPVNIVAAELEANSQTGEAIFSGSARLWTGNFVIQANQIDLHRANNQLVATGDVRAAFPQASLAAGASGTGKSTASAALRSGSARNHGQDSTVLWRVEAQRLEYVQEARSQQGNGQPVKLTKGAGGKVTLDGGVEVWSSQARIEAKTLIMDLHRLPNGRAELTQATGSGGVAIRQGERWGKAENARYDAATGQFVLWGGQPSLEDAAGDLVTGAELTFSDADDTILIESSEGSRTLTRHPVRN